MSGKISLKKIIEEVLAEKELLHNESSERRLRRAFDKLLETLGGNKDQLKGRDLVGAKIGFDKSEVPFMKIIIRQLYEGKGLIAKFTDKNSDISSMDVHDLIQSIIDEADKDGASEEGLADLMLFLTNLFNCSPMYLIEDCHSLLDILELNIQGLPTAHQALRLSKVLSFLKQEVAVQLIGDVSDLFEAAGIVQMSED